MSMSTVPGQPPAAGAAPPSPSSPPRPAPAPGGQAEVEVELFGRRRCHLCEEARAALQRIAREEGVPLRLIETDVDSDFVLRERYGLLVPVVLVRGERASELRLDEATVRARLLAAARSAVPEKGPHPGASPQEAAAGPTAATQRTGAM